MNVLDAIGGSSIIIIFGFACTIFMEISTREMPIEDSIDPICARLFGMSIIAFGLFIGGVTVLKHRGFMKKVAVGNVDMVEGPVRAGKQEDPESHVEYWIDVGDERFSCSGEVFNTFSQETGNVYRVYCVQHVILSAEFVAKRLITKNETTLKSSRPEHRKRL